MIAPKPKAYFVLSDTPVVSMAYVMVRHGHLSSEPLAATAALNDGTALARCTLSVARAYACEVVEVVAVPKGDMHTRYPVERHVLMVEHRMVSRGAVAVEVEAVAVAVMKKTADDDEANPTYPSLGQRRSSTDQNTLVSPDTPEAACGEWATLIHYALVQDANTADAKRAGTPAPAAAVDGESLAVRVEQRRMPLSVVTCEAEQTKKMPYRP